MLIDVKTTRGRGEHKTFDTVVCFIACKIFQII